MKFIIQILGPTGVGKSQVAFAVAKKFNAEIISADSVQVYKGFDIGTDKVTPEWRRKIPHHLLDIIDDCSQFDASKFLELSFAAVEDISRRGKIPLVCGGTALYLKIMIQGIFPESKNPCRRALLKQKAERSGWQALWQELRLIDPVYADKIGPNDQVRLIRALEIFHNSGLPPSEVFKQTRSPFAAYAFIRVGLRLEREKLYQNIDRRVETMLAKGLLAEVQELVRRYPPSCPPFKSLGYKEILSHLRAEIDLPTAVELIKRHSRQFAKRQLSWFRQEKDISWFAPENHAAITRFIKTCLSKKP